MLATIALLIRVRLGLTFASFQTVRKWLPVAAGITVAGRDRPTPAKIASYVRSGARLVPGATCLTQALACQILLQRNGIGSSLRLGVRRVGKALAAHAWVVVNDKILLGGTPSSLSEFSTIAHFGPVGR